MNRLFLPVFLVAVLSAGTANAADADLFSVPGVHVDATAESATAARAEALAEGRPVAWQLLFRRLTPEAVWERQPQLGDAALLRLTRSFEVSNERRSTTRYIGDITYHFDGPAVQRILRQAGLPYAETQAKPILVVPTVMGVYDPQSDWAKAWATPSIAQGLVPVMLPTADPADEAVISQPNLTQLNWAAFDPMVKRYGVAEIVIADATMGGNSVLLTEISPAGRQTETLAFAMSTFVATADAAATKLAEGWKERAAVDYSRRAQLVTDVTFNGLDDWSQIRSQLSSVRSIADMDVMGLSTNEAEIKITYYGRPGQLKEAMSQQNLSFNGQPGDYTLELGGAPQP